MAARGGLLKLLDAYIAIGGDAADFDKVVDQSEAKAKAAGGRLESAFSPRKVLGALGAAAGAVFGIATVGANELDAATRQLQADTNLTAEAAGKAEHAMAQIYRNNLQGFAEIGATMGVVINGLDLTGAAADAMTEKFMKFQTATGQGSGAVSAFHEILNAWNLDATAAPGIMDKLVASHQKYGSVVTENQSALLAIAPAMQAMNMSIDDGIGLLNLFDVAGINASKAPMALQRAITTLKPGQNINDLIAQISSIVDPTERAQAAMKIFGARGGVQMAQAFQPGITSVNEFKTSVEETTGATTEAAAAIESSFGNQFKLILKNAGGWLADFGTQFGPLLMVASAFGPGLTKAIGAGLGGLAGILIPKVTAAVVATGPGAALAASGVGTTIGAAMSAAVPIALAAGLGLGIALAFKSIVLDPGLQAQTKDIGTSVGKEIATGTLDSLDQSKAALQKGIADIGNVPLGGFLYGDQIGALNTQLDAVNAEIERRAAGIPEAIVAGVKATAPEVPLVIADLLKTITGTSLRAVGAAWKRTGADGMTELAAGITSARKKPLDAFDTLKTMLKNSMTLMAEVARLKGDLTSKELARGLQDGRPDVKAQALAVLKVTTDRLGELAAAGGPAGRAAMAQLDAGIRSKLPAVREASQAAKNAAVAQMNAAAGPAGDAGAAAGAAFAAAIRASIARALTSARRAAQSPGVPISGQAAGGAYPPGQVNWVGEQGPELRVSTLPGYTLTHQEAMTIASGAQGAGRGGATVNVTVYNPKPEPASTSTRRELRKLSLSGSVA